MKTLNSITKAKKRKATKGDWELTLMAVPTTIWYILFCFMPMFGLIIAFKDYKIQPGKGFIYNVIHSEWAGFKNFQFLIKSNDLYVTIFNSVATIDTYVFNALKSATPIGMTSAASFFQSVACCITILVANAIVKKIDNESSII